MTGWNALDDSLEAAAKWLENPELSTSMVRKGEIENLIGFTQLYVATQNPIYAWEAFLWLQEPRLMPDWILTFIRDQGCAIGQLATDASITPVDALDKLPDRLGLKRKGNAFSNHRKVSRQAHAADLVDQLEVAGHKSIQARELVGNKIGKKSSNTLGTYQKKTHKNWNAQQEIIDKLKEK